MAVNWSRGIVGKVDAFRWWDHRILTIFFRLWTFKAAGWRGGTAREKIGKKRDKGKTDFWWMSNWFSLAGSFVDDFQVVNFRWVGERLIFDRWAIGFRRTEIVFDRHLPISVFLFLSRNWFARGLQYSCCNRDAEILPHVPKHHPQIKSHPLANAKTSRPAPRKVLIQRNAHTKKTIPVSHMVAPSDFRFFRFFLPN